MQQGRRRGTTTSVRLPSGAEQPEKPAPPETQPEVLFASTSSWWCSFVSLLLTPSPTTAATILARQRDPIIMAAGSWSEDASIAGTGDETADR